MSDVHDRLRRFWDEDAKTYDRSPSHAASDPVEAAAWRAILRRHLPDWQPAGVVFTHDLAEQVWPGLDGYHLPTDHGAAVEAHTVALILTHLLAECGLPG